MTTHDVIGRMGCSHAAAAHWAAKNGVRRVPAGAILAYDWTEADVERFAARRGRGWEKGRARKEK